MTNYRSNEIKVGLVSVAAIILFIIGMTLGKNVNVSVLQKTVKLRFQNSGGITPSSTVVINGVKRGSVSTITSNTGSVLITAELDDAGDLREDATARITILEITGGKKLEIFPGKSEHKLDINKEIPGSTPPDMGELIALVGEASSSAISLVKRLDTVAAGITNLLDNGKTVETAKKTIGNASEMIAKLNRLIGDNQAGLNASLRDSRTIAADLKIAVRNNVPKVESLLAQLEETLNRTKTIIVKADTTLTHADGFISTMNSTVGDMKSSGSIASKILFDKEMGKKLDSVLIEIRILVDQISKNGINTNIRLGTRP